MKKINLNDTVKVKLTEHGTESFIDYYRGTESYPGVLPTRQWLEERIDSEGYLKTQLSELMSVLGPRIIFGSFDPLIEDNNIILVEEEN